MKFKQIYYDSNNLLNQIQRLGENSIILQLGIEFPYATSQNIFQKDDEEENNVIDQRMPILLTIKINNEETKHFYITEKHILEFQYIKLKVSDIESITIESIINPYFILNIGYE